MKVPAERPPKKAGCREYKEREAVRLEPREVGGGGGGLLCISHIGMCRPKGYGFGAVMVWKRLWFTRELR